MNKVLITTAIDYVNDVLHIGHAYQKIVADVLARYYRLTKGEENVFFLTGTDEHGGKAQEAAKAAGKPVKDFVDEIALADQKQQDALNISYDRFIRTTDSDHIITVVDFWKKVQKNGDIYPGEFKGKYCRGCESFKTETELENDHCPLHPKSKIELVIEKNYFFHWKKYVPFLKEHLAKHPQFVLPESRRNEVLAFVDKIEDLTISRRKEAVSWGIEVPGDPTQVIYVWFDALINYLTAAEPKGFWNEETQIIHILGKDNLRWHALLWPAMLKSAGYPLPTTIYAHGFLTLNGQKISKSLGNIIRPTELVDKFDGADPVRYYLLRYTSLEEDSDISIDKLKHAYNADLANGLGNLVARVAKLCETDGLEGIKDYSIDSQNLKERLEIGGYTAHLERFEFNLALEELWREIKSLDIKIEEDKPWAKSKQEREGYLKSYIKRLLSLARELQPFLPETAEKIQKQFAGPQIKSGPSLFPRI